MIETFNEIENNLEYWLGEYKSINEIEKYKDISSIQFDNLLRFLSKKIIPETFLTLENARVHNVLNVFNYKWLVDLFCDLCEKCDKIPSTNSLYKFAGVESIQVYNIKHKQISKENINNLYYSLMNQADESYILYVIDIINLYCNANYTINDIRKYNKEYSIQDNVVLDTTSNNIDNNKYSNINNILDFYNITYIVLNTIIYNFNNNREYMFRNILQDGKKNPVGTIAILNHDFAWDNKQVNTGASLENTTLSALPDFSDNTLKLE